jgi:hypothetical protein
MRHCFYCKKPMYSSNESIWIMGQNYDISLYIHKRCKDKYAVKLKGAKE